VLKFTSIELKADRELVIEAIRKDGSALQFATVEHKADRVIVLAAVRKTGTALRFVSDAFKSGREIAAFVGVQMQGRFAALKVEAWELGLR
jgi:histidinol phosphatase-like PHP family hydrolase